MPHLSDFSEYESLIHDWLTTCERCLRDDVPVDTLIHMVDAGESMWVCQRCADALDETDDDADDDVCVCVPIVIFVRFGET